MNDEFVELVIETIRPAEVREKIRVRVPKGTKPYEAKWMWEQGDDELEELDRTLEEYVYTDE